VRILDIPGRLWSLGRMVEDLLALQSKTREALEVVDSRLRALEDRLTHAEANQGQLIVEARAAASAASTTVTAAVISDVVTRLTRIEMRTERIATHLPPSEEA
jgi:hypothetical protein